MKSPVLLYVVVPAVVVAMWVKLDVLFILRSTVKPSSFDELSVQERLFWLPDTFVAESPDGAFGAEGVVVNETTVPNPVPLVELAIAQ